MKLSNPTMTVQNANGRQVLVRVHHQLNDAESIDVAYLVDRSDSLDQLELAVLLRLRASADLLLAKFPAPPTPSA